MQHQFCGLEPGGTLGIIGIGGHSGLQVALSKRVAAELESSDSRSRFGLRVVAVRLQAQTVLGESVLVILCLKKKIPDACVLGRIVARFAASAINSDCA